MLCPQKKFFVIIKALGIWIQWCFATNTSAYKECTEDKRVQQSQIWSKSLKHPQLPAQEKISSFPALCSLPELFWSVRDTAALEGCFSAPEMLQVLHSGNDRFWLSEGIQDWLIPSERVLGCAQSRAELLGSAELQGEHCFSIPCVPLSLQAPNPEATGEKIQKMPFFYGELYFDCALKWIDFESKLFPQEPRVQGVYLSPCHQ